MPKLLIVAFVALAAATASATPAKDSVSLTGGVCNDDPLTIVQNPEGPTPHYFTFSDECEVLSVDNKVWGGVDQPPVIFICHAFGGSILSGATYKKARNSIIDSTDDLRVDTRVYTYKCIKGCSRAPATIKYKIEDCG
jgi:hypothetical protein